MHSVDKQIINPPTLPQPRGYNHGILVTGGRLLFLAGQDASDASGRIVAPGDLIAQAEQVLRNLQAVVTAAGGTLRDIVKLTIFVHDRDAYVANLKPLGQVFRSYFGAYYPAMALFEVSGFFQENALIEIEGIAVLPDEAGVPPGP
jgi:enamine deaminase RidA (YjgF/YER057c/UK114 family)